MDGHGTIGLGPTGRHLKESNPPFCLWVFGAKPLEVGRAVVKDEEGAQGFSFHIPHLALAIESLHSQLASWAPAVSSSAFFLPSSQEAFGFLRLRAEEGQ